MLVPWWLAQHSVRAQHPSGEPKQDVAQAVVQLRVGAELAGIEMPAVRVPGLAALAAVRLKSGLQLWGGLQGIQVESCAELIRGDDAAMVGWCGCQPSHGAAPRARLQPQAAKLTSLIPGRNPISCVEHRRQGPLREWYEIGVGVIPAGLKCERGGGAESVGQGAGGLTQNPPMGNKEEGAGLLEGVGEGEGGGPQVDRCQLREPACHAGPAG